LVMGEWVDWRILWGFSNLSDSMILLFYDCQCRDVLHILGCTVQVPPPSMYLSMAAWVLA